MIVESIRIALRALRANKGRSVLTMLGVIIGVFAITALIGVGEGVKRDVTNEVTSLGSNLIFVLPGQVQTGEGFNPTASLGASTLTTADVETIRRVAKVERTTILSLLSGFPSVGEQTAPTTLSLAVDPEYFPIMNTAELVAGRVLNEDDEARRARVVVIDRGPRTALFPGQSPEAVLGTTITFKGESYEIVGVLESDPSPLSFGGPNFSNAMLLPFATATERIANTQIFRIVAKASDTEDVKAVVAEIQASVLKNHAGTEDFTVLTQEDILSVLDSVLSLLTNAVVGIGAISLLVGGIGIMNIMLVSVTERTREVGVRKALGASNGHVLFQFLLEAVILSVLGGAIGVLLAFGVSFPIEAQAGLTLLLNLPTIGLATLFSVLVGVVFGVAPALRASRLNPIDALRYE